MLECKHSPNSELRLQVPLISSFSSHLHSVHVATYSMQFARNCETYTTLITVGQIALGQYRKVINVLTHSKPLLVDTDSSSCAVSFESVHCVTAA